MANIYSNLAAVVSTVEEAYTKIIIDNDKVTGAAIYQEVPVNSGGAGFNNSAGLVDELKISSDERNKVLILRGIEGGPGINIDVVSAGSSTSEKKIVISATGSGGGSGGASSNGANLGTIGQGVYINTQGSTLNFKNIAAGTSGIVTVSSDGNNNILVDVKPSTLTLSTLGGSLALSQMPVGANGTVLTTVGGVATWAAATAPTLPTKLSQFTNDLSTLTAGAGITTFTYNGSGAATVAINNSYFGSLAFKSSVAWNTDITGKPTFATVATTGNYSDLYGTPVLATVATTGKASDLNNNTGWITAAQAPVTSVAGRTGAIVLSAADISGLANIAKTGKLTDALDAPGNNYVLTTSTTGAITWATISSIIGSGGTGLTSVAATNNNVGASALSATVSGATATVNLNQSMLSIATTQLTGKVALNQITGGSVAGNVLTTDASGNVSWAAVPSTGGTYSYTLPQATTSTLGGVTVDGTTITATAGQISVGSIANTQVTGLGALATASNVNLGTQVTGTLSVANIAAGTAGQVLTTNSSGATVWAAPSGSGTSSYTLPVATATTLGGVKQGANVTIAADGTISVAAPVAQVQSDWNATTGLAQILNKPTIPTAYTLIPATTSVLGGVIADGTSISVDGTGKIGVIDSAITIGHNQVTGLSALATASSVDLGSQVSGTLPVASLSHGTNVGDILTWNGSTISWSAPSGGTGSGGYTLPSASTTELGGVTVDGTTITATPAGQISVISLPYALTAGTGITSTATYNGSAAVTFSVNPAALTTSFAAVDSNGKITLTSLPNGTTAGQVLTWNGTSVVWGSVAVTSVTATNTAGTALSATNASGAVTVNFDPSKINVENLGDVSVSSVQQYNVLAWNGSKWANMSPASLQGPGSTVTSITAASSAIVVTNGQTTAPSIGFAPAQVDPTTLKATGTAANQVLTYNGSALVWALPSFSVSQDATPTLSGNLAVGTHSITSTTGYVNIGGVGYGTKSSAVVAKSSTVTSFIALPVGNSTLFVDYVINMDTADFSSGTIYYTNNGTNWVLTDNGAEYGNIPVSFTAVSGGISATNASATTSATISYVVRTF